MLAKRLPESTGRPHRPAARDYKSALSSFAGIVVD